MRNLRAFARLSRRLGLRRMLRYERERRRRERLLGRRFDPAVDGEPLARALGYGDAEVQKLRDAGLA